MTDTQAELILGLLHRLSDQVDTVRSDVTDIKVQTALNSSVTKQYMIKTDALEISHINCKEACSKRLEEATSVTRYIKWLSATAVSICAVLAVFLELFSKSK